MLLIACKCENADIVAILLEAKVATNQRVCLGRAQHLNNVQIVRQLLSSGGIPQQKVDSELLESAREGHFDLVQVFLEEAKADPTYHYSGCLMKSSYFGHVEIVKLLLDDGRANPETKEAYESGHPESALEEAVRGNHVEVVRLLLRDGRSTADAGMIGLASDKPSPNSMQIVDMLLDFDDKFCVCDATNYSLVNAKNRDVHALLIHYYDAHRELNRKPEVVRNLHYNVAKHARTFEQHVQGAVKMAKLCKGLILNMDIPRGIAIKIVSMAFADKIIVSYEHRKERDGRCKVLLKDIV